MVSDVVSENEEKNGFSFGLTINLFAICEEQFGPIY